MTPSPSLKRSANGKATKVRLWHAVHFRSLGTSPIWERN